MGAEVFVADTARVIGDVCLGDHTSIWYGAVVRGDVHHVRIGDRVNIQDLSVVHVTAGRYPTIVHDDVTVGHRAVLHGCTIHQGALVGMGAVVMDQAVVGEWAMVGAGALVPPGAVIPPRTLAVGSPARVRRDLNQEELDWLTYSAEHYRKLAQTYMADGHGAVGGPS
ncbi:MAG: gamma carbonic anhydrase family protein [Myxococcota bacterium]|nr:gamma carbonic anhydrase family protein [Myxococcota bacterium]MEE2780378.1 gamma carbonic anhydrase family protein [Myxococcota bacterium]